jgi:hypothetical protein
LSHDILTLAGPALATRQVLFDFIVEELAKREPEDVQRIRPLRVALPNQRDNLFAFAGVLDAKLANIARAYVIAEHLVREPACCTDCRAPHPPIGRDGIDFGRSWVTNSTRCPTPSARSWLKHHAAVRS